MIARRREQPRAPAGSATREMLVDFLAEDVRLRGRTRRRVLLGCVLLGGLLGLARGISRRPPYEATGRAELFLRAAPASRQQSLRKGGMLIERELMLGRSFLEQVLDHMDPAEELRLVGGHRILPGKHARSLHAEQAMNALAGLQVEPERGTDLMVIRFTSQDPRLAAAVVRAALQSAEELGLRQRQEQAERLQAVLGFRLQELERTIEQGEAEQESRLRVLRAEGSFGLGVPGLDAGQAAALAPLGRRDRQALKHARRFGNQSRAQQGDSKEQEETRRDVLLDTLRVALDKSTLLLRLETARARTLRELEDGGQWDALERAATGTDRTRLDELRAQQREWQARLAGASDSMAGGNLSLRSVAAQLAATETELRAAERLTVDHAEAAVQLQKRQQTALASAYRQRRGWEAAQRRDSDAETMPELALAVDEQVEAAERDVLRSAPVDAALKSSSFYPVDSPAVPLRRLPRPLGGDTFAGLVAGLLCGMGFSLLSMTRSGRRWTVAEVEARSGLPVLALLPRPKRGKSKLRTGPVNPRDPHGLYRHVLEELAGIFQTVPGSTPAVLITSVHAGEGRTTLAADLARALAKTRGEVLLVDADTHHPTLHRHFGLSLAPGLQERLRGEADGVPQPVKTVAGLSVLTAGRAVPQYTFPAAAWDELLHGLRQEGAEMLVADTPALSESWAAASLAGSGDVVLLAVRYGRTRLGELVASARTLRVTHGVRVGLVVLGAGPEL